MPNKHKTRVKGSPLVLAICTLTALITAAFFTAPPNANAQSRSNSPDLCQGNCISTIEAVTYASYLGSKAGVTGRFELPVRSVGEQNGRFFLNSEKDYRDRNCLTVVIEGEMMRRLIGSKSEELAKRHFIGKTIIVDGTARQKRIDFFDGEGQRTGKYYFQIHLPLTRIANLSERP